jgi:hypothetical protein
MELVKTYIESLEAEGRKSLRMKKLPLNPNDLTVGEAVFLANYCAKLMQTETWSKMKQADATSNNK